ncbi:MAG TPA: class I SAM-dependent methyltransferase [Flavobacteriales bacterium]|nr:class I SAM-dependent methyltransferase [Flavobacteriales bacterium]
MSWFANWFDSPYYHILYKNRDDKEAEFFIENLVQHLHIKKRNKLLDIACGKGRHAKYFNSLGLNVVGVDLSFNSITAAKKDENETLQFFIHDMREVYQENHFDVVTNLFTSFGYFEKDEDEQKAINAMASNLKKEGILVIDFMNAKNVMVNLVASEIKIIDGITFNIKRSVRNNHIIKDIHISDSKTKHHFQEKVKALTLANFSDFIANAGLKIIDIFGNYKLEEFNTQTSDRLILICKK